MNRPENDKLWLVVNRASGSNDPDTVANLEASLRRHGANLDQTIDVRDNSDLSPAALDAQGVTCLAIFTGDGTVSSVIGGLEGWDGHVLVLPGGTTNLLAKALHGQDVALAPLLDRYAAGQLQPVRRHGVAWHGGMAVCEVLAGPGAIWGDVREEMRDGNVAGVAATAIEAARQSGGSAQVRIAQPAMGLDTGYGGVRIVPQDHGLTVDGYGAEGFADYLRQGLALLRRDFREGPHDDLGQHGRLVCQSLDGSPIELLIDGERETGGAEEHFSLAPITVDLLATTG